MMTEAKDKSSNTGLVQVVTANNLMWFALKSPVAVLHFWAEWDSSLHFARHRINALSRRFLEVNFGMMDIDDQLNWNVVKAYDVTKVPTTLFMISGSLRHREEGTKSMLLFSKIIRECIAHDNRIEGIRQRFLSKQEAKGTP